MKIGLFPEGIVLATRAVPVLLTGAAPAPQSTGTPRQEISCGSRFSCTPRSIAYAPANTFPVPTGANSANYLYKTACAGKKARSLEGPLSASTGFTITTPSGYELVYNALCRQR